jgi:hypothetical protein
MIEGVGNDAPLETNIKGGKQSKSEYAFHLVDACFALTFIGQIEHSTAFENEQYVESVKSIYGYMADGNDDDLFDAVNTLSDNEGFSDLHKIAKRLKFGQNKGYAPNNWRLIPREEHINHAIMHLFALIEDNTEDDHKAAALCRLHMAIATKETEGFSYNKPMEADVEADVDELFSEASKKRGW